MLFGYPSSLALLADYASQHDYRVDDLGIKVIFVTSESLYDYQRKSIESVFAAPVANGYGGRDAGFIAHECPHRAMHITAEDIIV
jgi:phenylacetate-CoA ligase